MKSKQRIALAVASAAMSITVVTGCGALHDAPVSNSTANASLLKDGSGISQAVKAQADAQRRQADTDRKQPGAPQSKKAATPKTSASKPKAPSKDKEKVETKAAPADRGGNMAPVASTSDLPDWVSVINWAQTKLGTPYLWGGNGTKAQNGRFDCSGLTKAAYARVGINLPRVAQDQYIASRVHPSESQLLPGDLVFFGSRYDLHHVGIYLGSGMMIHAPRSGARIRFNKVHYMTDYFGATRVARDY